MARYSRGARLSLKVLQCSPSTTDPNRVVLCRNSHTQNDLITEFSDNSLEFRLDLVDKRLVTSDLDSVR